MEVKYYLRRKMNEFNLSPKRMAELSGVGVRFVYEMLAGKPTLRMDKVNDVLRIFDARLGFELLPEVLKRMREEELDRFFHHKTIPVRKSEDDISGSAPDYRMDRENEF